MFVARAAPLGVALLRSTVEVAEATIRAKIIASAMTSSRSISSAQHALYAAFFMLACSESAASPPSTGNQVPETSQNLGAEPMHAEASPFEPFQIRFVAEGEGESIVSFDARGTITSMTRVDGETASFPMGTISPDGRWIQAGALVGILRPEVAEYLVDARHVQAIDERGVAGSPPDRRYFNEEGFYVNGETVFNTPEMNVLLIPASLAGPSRRVAVFVAGAL